MPSSFCLLVAAPLPEKLAIPSAETAKLVLRCNVSKARLKAVKAKPFAETARLVSRAIAFAAFQVQSPRSAPSIQPAADKNASTSKVILKTVALVETHALTSKSVTMVSV